MLQCLYNSSPAYWKTIILGSAQMPGPFEVFPDTLILPVPNMELIAPSEFPDFFLLFCFSICVFTPCFVVLLVRRSLCVETVSIEGEPWIFFLVY